MEIYIKAVVLAAIEGATEFLPVSSTGHLIIAEALMPLTEDAAFNNAFLVIIQLPAIAAVAVYFWRDLWPPRTAGAKRSEIYAMWGKILAAFAPAIVLGALLDDLIERYLYFPVPVAAALVLGGVILLGVERAQLRVTVPTVADLTLRTAVLIGLIQCVAMIPGVSRSGATIVGAMLLGLSRPAAAEFSFFLAIPTMVAATGYKLIQGGLGFTGDQWMLLAIGGVASFLVAYAVVAAFMGYIRRRDFKAFGYYRIALGAAVFALAAAGLI